MHNVKLKPLIVGIPATGDMLGIGRTKVFHLLKNRQLSAVKIGRRTLVTMESIECFVAMAQSGGATR